MLNDTTVVCVSTWGAQDEAGTPFCLTIDGQTLEDDTVTIRDRDSLEQWRCPLADCETELAAKLS